MELLDRRLETAMRANLSHETLRGHADQAGGDSERLDADVGETRDRADGVVGVQCRQYQVTRHRRLEGDGGRLLTADFSDEQDVRILTQRRPQHPGEREALLLVHLPLVDAAQSVLDLAFP